jgi:bifunctional protein TilS/HprT
VSKQVIGFNKALGEIAEAFNSSLTPGEKLRLLVKVTARGLGVRGCSLLLLDAQRKRLMHAASHGLSERYLRKGFLGSEQMLCETLEGKTAEIRDVVTDPRIQFHERAQQEHISSILGVPVKIKDEVVGTLRVYSRTSREFTSAETAFLRTVANLAAVVLESGRLIEQERQAQAAETRVMPKPAPLGAQLKPTTFAHPSEEEFARLLDFYQIEWLYEPRSFELRWDGGRGVEMFTPDFYLPGLDLYIEMTTLKPALAREKKRKVSRLKELYPEINIKLLARRDYDRLLAKYGHGPLAGAKTRGLGRVFFSAAQIQRRVRQLAREISKDYEGRHLVLVGVLRGVFCFMADLMRYLTVPVDVDFMAISYYGVGSSKAVHVTKDLDLDLEGRHVLLVEDIVDTGMTLSYVLGYLKERKPASLAVCTLLDKRVRRLVEVPVAYVGFEVPDEFLVGYGLDYQEEYRNLPFIALLSEEKPDVQEDPQQSG